MLVIQKSVVEKISVAFSINDDSLAVYITITFNLYNVQSRLRVIEGILLDEDRKCFLTKETAHFHRTLLGYESSDFGFCTLSRMNTYIYMVTSVFYG